MPKGKIITPKEAKEQDNFSSVDDMKVRQTLLLMTNRYNEQIRDLIKATYNDKKLLKKWQKIRESGVHQKGGDSGVHRKLVEFPNPWVFDFADTVMNSLYGVDWIKDNRALNHDLVKPWLVVKKI